MRAPDLDRLFRAAAASPNEPLPEMPFGFDTRVLARARGERADNGDVWAFARMFRRATLTAVIVTICAGSAAWWQLQQNDDLDSPTANAYAIADSAIEAATWQ
jgi:anti-sigma-K factor RskA